MLYLRDSIWSLFFLGVVKHNVKCASVMCLGVLDHGAYCAIVVICLLRYVRMCQIKTSAVLLPKWYPSFVAD